MTGPLHGARKERAWAKVSRYPFWYHSQPKFTLADCAKLRRLLRGDTWLNVSLKVSLRSRFWFFSLLSHKANHLDTKLFAYIRNAKRMHAVQRFWAPTFVEDIGILGTWLTSMACGGENKVICIFIVVLLSNLSKYSLKIFFKTQYHFNKTCVYIQIYIWVYIYIYTHMHINTHTCIRTQQKQSS